MKNYMKTLIYHAAYKAPYRETHLGIIYGIVDGYNSRYDRKNM